MFGKVPSIRAELSDKVSFDFGATELSNRFSGCGIFYLLLQGTNKLVSVESAMLLVGGDFHLLGHV